MYNFLGQSQSWMVELKLVEGNLLELEGVRMQNHFQQDFLHRRFEVWRAER